MSTFGNMYRTPLLAMALNLSGTGAGYLWARAWWFVPVHWLGLIVWWALATSTTAWFVVLLVWVGLSVVAAWFLGLARVARERAAYDHVLTEGHRSRWPSVVGAVLAVALLTGTMIGAGSYRAGAADSYTGALDAHAEGRCHAAIRALEELDDGTFRRGFAASPEAVDAEIEACTTLESARSLADEGNLGSAVETYDEYLDAEPARFDGAAAEQAWTRLENGDDMAKRGARDRALEEYSTVVESGLPAAEEVPEHVDKMFREALAERRTRCGTVEELEWFAARDDVEVAADVAAKARDRLPDAVLGCAERRFAEARAEAKERPRKYDADRFDVARSTARKVIRDFPRSGQADEARSLIGRIAEAKTFAAERKKVLDQKAAERRRRQAIIDEIEETTGGKLPPPRATGSSGTNSAQVVVENGTAETIEVLWTGPSTGKVRIPPGSGGRCLAGGGPTRSISLAPGNYTVVVRAVTDTAVIPYKGAWDMSTGTRYGGECYYIETSFW